MGLLGWLWGVTQFRLNRPYQKSDKAIEKRFEIYSNFMTQMDEMSTTLRNDPKTTYGISTEFMSKVLTGDEEEINSALLTLNENLLESTKISVQLMMIVNSELNKLRLIASEKILLKINEYKELVNDYTNEFQLVLRSLSTTKSLETNAKEFTSIGQNARNERMMALWKEIESAMRDEIDYYKK